MKRYEQPEMELWRISDEVQTYDVMLASRGENTQKYSGGDDEIVWS